MTGTEQASALAVDLRKYADRTTGDRFNPDELCPECKGQGGGTRDFHAQVCGTIEDDETRAQFHAQNCRTETWTCRACHGSGKLVGLPRAIYMARGGLPPVQIRGYA